MRNGLLNGLTSLTDHLCFETAPIRADFGGERREIQGRCYDSIVLGHRLLDADAKKNERVCGSSDAGMPACDAMDGSSRSAAGGTENSSIWSTVRRSIPNRFAAARPLNENGAPHATVKLHALHPRPLPKAEGYHRHSFAPASSRAIRPPRWGIIAPAFSPRPTKRNDQFSVERGQIDCLLLWPILAVKRAVGGSCVGKADRANGSRRARPYRLHRRIGSYGATCRGAPNGRGR